MRTSLHPYVWVSDDQMEMGDSSSSYFHASDGNMYHVDGQMNDICCDSPSFSFEIPAVSPRLYFSQESIYVDTLISGDTWSLFSEKAFGFSFFDQSSVFLQALDSDLTIPPMSSSPSNCIDLNVPESTVSIYDPQRPQPNAFIWRFSCLGSSGVPNICSNMSVVYGNENESYLDPSSATFNDFLSLLGAESKSVGESLTVSYGSYFVYKSGKNSYMVVRAEGNDAKNTWKKGVSKIVSVNSSAFSGYDATSCAGTQKGPVSLRGMNGALGHAILNGMNCAVESKNSSRLSCFCSDPSCKATNISLNEKYGFHYAFSPNFNSANLINESFFQELDFAYNAFLTDAFYFKLAVNTQPMMYNLFMNELVNAYSSGHIRHAEFMWYMKQWLRTPATEFSASAYGQARSRLDFLKKGIKYMYSSESSMQLQETSSQVLEYFATLYDSMNAVAENIEQLRALQKIEDDIASISSGLQQSSDNFIQMNQQQLLLMNGTIKGYNSSISSIINTTQFLIPEMEEELQNLVDELKEKQKQMSLWNSLTLSLTFLTGLSSLTMGFAAGMNTYYQSQTTKPTSISDWFVSTKGGGATRVVNAGMTEVSSLTAFTSSVLLGISSVPSTDNCMSSLSSTVQNMYVSFAAAQDFYAEAILDLNEVMNSNFTEQIVSSQLTLSTAVDAQLLGCISGEVQQFREGCDALGVDCSSYINMITQLQVYTEAIGDQTSKFMDLVIDYINLMIQNQAYKTNAEVWADIDAHYVQEHDAINSIIDQSYQTLAQQASYIDSYNMQFCATFAYQFGITLQEVSNDCAVWMTPISTLAASSNNLLLGPEKRSNDLLVEYGNKLSGTVFQNRMRAIPNINENHTYGFDLAGFLNTTFISESGVLAYQGDFNIPADYEWINQYLEIYNYYDNFKLAAARIQFFGLDASNCQGFTASISTKSAMTYYEQTEQSSRSEYSVTRFITEVRV